MVTYGMTGLSGVGTPSLLRFPAFFAPGSGAGDTIINYRLELCMVSPEQVLTRDRRHRFGDTTLNYRRELCMVSPE